MCFHENEAEYGSAKIIRVFTENENLITFVLEEQISSNFQNLFAKTFEFTYRKQNFYNCSISNFQFFDSFGKDLFNSFILFTVNV